LQALIRIFTRRFFWVVNIIFALLLLCTKLIPIISPSQFKLMGILGLATPFIASANIAFIVLWFFFRKWSKSLLSIFCIIISWNIFSVGFAGNLQLNDVPDSTQNTFSIASYNVRLFDLYKWSNTKDSRTKMMGYLHQKDADILCLQEFYSSDYDSIGIQNARVIAKTMGYTYEARNINFQTKRGFFGDIVFSKYPIINSRSLNLDTSLLTHKFQYVDIVIRNTDTIRLFNLHLQSVKFNADDYKLLEDEKGPASKTSFMQSKIIINKLAVSFEKRSKQADIVSFEINKSPYATIVCGDLNDLPSSYTYFKVRGTLKDAFLEKGFGLGRTYTGISPILRIDYILFDSKKLKVFEIEKNNVKYSDHFPQKAWFGIKIKK
jgi:endonuclease/exonuclease/phosphatase family metal-dependent hydrolase